MPNDEFLTMTVKCRTAIEVLLLFVSLCIIVMFDILSFSFKSIPFLINIHFDVMMMMSTFNKTNTLSCIYIVLDQ